MSELVTIFSKPLCHHSTQFADTIALSRLSADIHITPLKTLFLKQSYDCRLLF